MPVSVEISLSSSFMNNDHKRDSCHLQGYKKMIQAGLPNVQSMTMVIMVIMAMAMIMTMVVMAMVVMAKMAIMGVIIMGIVLSFDMTQVLELAVSRLHTWESKVPPQSYPPNK